MRLFQFSLSFASALLWKFSVANHFICDHFCEFSASFVWYPCGIRIAIWIHIKSFRSSSLIDVWKLIEFSDQMPLSVFTVYLLSNDKLERSFNNIKFIWDILSRASIQDRPYHEYLRTWSSLREKLYLKTIEDH